MFDDSESQMHYISRLRPDKSHFRGQQFFYGPLKALWALNPFIQEPQAEANL